ncbi:MAG: hypothetical protein AAF570_16905, partial [Bacteroidota bacterium]
MRKAFVTISTRSHLGKALALCRSVKACSNGVELMILVMDGAEMDEQLAKNEGIRLLKLGEMEKVAVGKKLIRQYGNAADADRLRWSLKPVLMMHLLEYEGFERVIYGDNDLFFFENADFLYDALAEKSMLL